MSKKLSRDGKLAWEVFLQYLDVTSGELVNGARKECKNPLTIHTNFGLSKCKSCITMPQNFNPIAGFL